MGALDACSDSDLWLLGDGPCAMLAERPGLVQRFHAERSRKPKLEALFQTMMTYERDVEQDTSSWWFNPDA